MAGAASVLVEQLALLANEPALPPLEPLVCLAVVGFHHKRGIEAELLYPPDTLTQAEADIVSRHSMPDSSHLRDEDINFFNFIDSRGQLLYGVSFFKQVRATLEMKL
jgi:hypothetical protein